ncbi:ABC transporter permease subunit [Aerococcus tenax]|uniref:ABC transporter permease subunit n=1 Tax=Aerococcus tenax TaxID=3078812 RepID=UPI0018A73DA9|nr:ABC transporter permease subunit [Aerococcus tenax]
MIAGFDLKKSWIVMVIALVTIFGLVANHHVEAEEAAPQERMESVEEGPKRGDKVVIGLDDTFAPMGFRNGQNEIVGFDIDLAQAIAEIYGWELDFQPIDWAMKETELNSGNIDLLWNGVGITPEREEQMLFSQPYFESPNIVITKKGSPIKELSDLVGKTISTQSGSTTAEDIKDWPNQLYQKLAQKPVLYSSYNEVFADLDSGRVDAVVTDYTYGHYIMEVRGEEKYDSFVDPSKEPEQMAVAMRKSASGLKTMIDQGLDQVKANGKYDEIVAKWFGENRQVASQENIIQKILPSLWSGFKLTLVLFVLVLALSLPLGFLIAIMRVFSPKLIQWLIEGYVFVMRGSPLMLQLMMVFFGLPYLGINLDRFTAALIAFVINYAAYFAEIFRGGITSVPQGQYESIKVLGIGWQRGFRRIILPQVMKITLPSVGNEVIALVKDTSLVYVIGLGELLRAGSIAANTYATIIPYLVCGVFYLIFTAFVTLALRRIEYRVSW